MPSVFRHRGAPHDFTRMYISAVDGAMEKLFAADHTVAVVEKDASEDLARMVVQLDLEVSTRRFRAGQQIPVLDLLLQITTAQCQHGLQLGVLRLAQAFDPAKALLVRAE